MYSYEQRRVAIERYIKYDLQVNPVVKELGYPSKRILYKWYKEYLELGGIPRKYTRKSPYSEEQKNIAIDYYIDHGKSLSNTIRKLGYPTKVTLRTWISDKYPDAQKRCDTHKYKVRYSYDKKKQAVFDHCKREASGEEIAKSHGIPRSTLYRWQKELLSVEKIESMSNQKKAISDKGITISKEQLERDIEELKKEVFELKLERDILKKASEILKKK